MEALFAYYLKHPKEIGSQSRTRIETDGLHRVICDYLSGMTDRYVALEYERLGL
jgi:dGTPase